MSRIVQLANFYGPESGGIRTVVDRLACGYVRAGHEVVVVVPGGEDAIVESEGGRRIVLRSPRLPGGGGYRILASRAKVAALLDELRPDRLEVSDKLSLTWIGRWAAARGIPTVLISHERLDAILDVRVPRQVPLAGMARAWNKRLARSFGQVVCASAFAADEFSGLGASLRLVPLGVDLDTFTPGRGGETGVLELVTLGRLSAEKRPEQAVEALRWLGARGVEARLTMIGAGPRRAALEAQADGLTVTFTGHVSEPDQVAALLGQADVALAPCPVEGFGLGVLEALACATPVVVGVGGAAPELIDPWCGRAAPARGPDLARAVLSMLAVPEPIRRRAARRRAESYPWDATVEGMLDAHRLLPSVRS